LWAYPASLGALSAATDLVTDLVAAKL